MTMEIPDVVMHFELKALDEGDFIGNKMMLECRVVAGDRNLGGAAISLPSTPTYMYPEVRNAYVGIVLRLAIDDVLRNSTIIESDR